MDERKKTFDEVSIVIMVLLALGNDGAEIFFDLLAATIVGLPGEAIMEPINLAMDGIFTFWFFAKCGFGGPSIIQLVDDLLELVGIPGRTICVVAGILIANNPKLAAVAEMAGAAALTGGAGAAATEAGGGTTEIGAVATKRATTTIAEEETTGATTEAESTSGGARGEMKESGGVGQTSGETTFSGEEMEPEAEQPPVKVLQEKLLEQTPKKEGGQEDEDREDGGAAGEGRSNVISFQKRAEEIKRRQQKLPKIIDINKSGEDASELAA